MVDIIQNWPMKKRVLVKDILKQTAEITGIPAETILGKSRIGPVSRARHEFFYNCEEALKLGCHRIGVLTGFNHTSVMNGIYWHAERNDKPVLTGYDGKKHREECRIRAKPAYKPPHPRTTRMVTFKGRTKSLTYWSKVTGITYSAILYRLRARWPVDDVLTIPLRVHASKNA